MLYFHHMLQSTRRIITYRYNVNKSNLTNAFNQVKTMTWSPAPQSSTDPSFQPKTTAFVNFVTRHTNDSYDSYINKNYDENEIHKRKYDFIIVGAGTAGCVVANRLSEISSWKILMLEVGGEEPLTCEVPGLQPLLLNSSVDHAYKTQPESIECAGEDMSRSFQYSAGRVMGGTSSINGQWYIRGHKQDYDDWADLGNPGWGWKDVLPYFKKSEDMRDPEVLAKSAEFHGTGGYLTVERPPHKDKSVEVVFNAWKELGFKEIDYNSGEQIGTSRMQIASIHGARQSTNGAFLRTIRAQRQNLFVKSKAHATKIIIDLVTKRAVGVEYTDVKSSTSFNVFADKEVIISAGAMASPMLLMLSGIGPADHLQEVKIDVIEDLPVGNNIRNHLNIPAIYFNLPHSLSTLPDFENAENDLLYWLNTHEGPLSASGIEDNITYYQTPYATEPGLPDIELTFKRYISDTSAAAQYIPYSYYDGMIARLTLLKTVGLATLRLDKDNPVWGKPVITTNYVNSEDVKKLVAGIKIARGLENTKAFKERGIVRDKKPMKGCEQFEFDSDEYLECFVKSKCAPSQHSVGSCKMGPRSDAEAVVDARLKVHGIDGLRVIDVSIMPTIIRGATMAPAIMIGEKASDLIKDDWVLSAGE